MRAYFPFTFIVGNHKYCCIWYSDSVDGFVMEDGKIKCFADMSKLISYVVAQNLKMAEETSLLFVDGFTHWLVEPTEIDCEEFLMFWNVMTGLAHSAGKLFYGDLDTKYLNAIYDRLFVGSQLHTQQLSKSMKVLVWDKQERSELTKVVESGLSIITSCLILPHN